MQLHLAVRNAFDQLAGSLCLLQPREYPQPCKTLSGHSIGQHVRHIIELFQALQTGYGTGIVNYEKRKRELTIETDRDLACLLLEQIYQDLDRPDKPLLLETSFADDPAGLPLLLSSNYNREIAYNLEHTIHHMALIRIGINEVDPSLVLPEEYGIASATIKYRRQCAQ
jgi:hypothetical protein